MVLEQMDACIKKKIDLNQSQISIYSVKLQRLLGKQEENIMMWLQASGIKFLDLTPKTRPIKEKKDKLDLIKI